MASRTERAGRTSSQSGLHLSNFPLAPSRGQVSSYTLVKLPKIENDLSLKETKGERGGGWAINQSGRRLSVCMRLHSMHPSWHTLN